VLSIETLLPIGNVIQLFSSTTPGSLSRENWLLPDWGPYLL
jgi:hypothetical protein